jgi:uncharacterized RDD family membrane protein YckC
MGKVSSLSDVVTGEAVVIDVPCARFPSRMAAIAIDMLVQLTGLAVLSLIVVGAGANGGLNAAAEGAITLSIFVLVIVGYPTLFETLSRGKSLGKLALGLRVVGDDGSPERFRQALVRALASVVEIWLFVGCPALITSMISAKGKRLGDMFAGTFVIQERLPARDYLPMAMPPQLAAWAASLELSGLSGETAAMARGYLARYWELAPAAREEFGNRIAGDVASRVGPPPPPGTPPPAYLSAVLAERRRREQVRLATQQAAQTGYGYGYGYVPPTPWPPATTPGSSPSVPWPPAPTPWSPTPAPGPPPSAAWPPAPTPWSPVSAPSPPPSAPWSPGASPGSSPSAAWPPAPTAWSPVSAPSPPPSAPWSPVVHQDSSASQDPAAPQDSAAPQGFAASQDSSAPQGSGFVPPN